MLIVKWLMAWTWVGILLLGIFVVVEIKGEFPRHKALLALVWILALPVLTIGFISVRAKGWANRRAIRRRPGAVRSVVS